MVCHEWSNCFRLNSDELDHLGIDRQDHMSFVNLLDHVAELPRRTGVAQYATGAQHRHSLTSPTGAQWQFHSLPPTLTTLTGLRGLLLYRNALQLQANDEATRFDESAESTVNPELSTTTDQEGVIIEPFGNARADQLLLFRLLSLFYWPDRFSKKQCHVLPSTWLEIEPEVIHPFHLKSHAYDDIDGSQVLQFFFMKDILSEWIALRELNISTLDHWHMIWDSCEILSYS